jgi:hypothetical protein
MTQPVGGASAREIPFHVLRDTEYLSLDDSWTRFFANSHTFAAAGHGPKHSEECNLGTQGGCMPEGRKKFVQRFAIHVAREDDDVRLDVRILYAERVVFKAEMGTGYRHAALVEAPAVDLAGKIQFYVQPGREAWPIEREAIKRPLWLEHLESFCVEVLAPKTLRGAYCVVSLHGTLLVAETA